MFIENEIKFILAYKKWSALTVNSVVDTVAAAIIASASVDVVIIIEVAIDAKEATTRNTKRIEKHSSTLMM